MIFRNLLIRDLKLVVRQPTDTIATLFFFIIVIGLFPLGIGPEFELLRRIAPGILWVAALLATMLSLSRLFIDDYRDGTLEQFALSPQPLVYIVFAKIVAHWLTTGLPLTLLSPLLGLQFDLPAKSLVILVITLGIGTPALSAIGSIGTALTLGVRGGGMLISLLVLPLYVPILIFGAGALEASLAGSGVEANLSLLAAMTITAFCLAPWACASALRIALE